MEKYKILHVESGTFIREFLTPEEAQKCIERMEEADKQQDEYESDQYIIKEVYE